MAIVLDVLPVIREFERVWLYKFPRWNETFYKRLLHALGYTMVRVWQRAVKQARLDEVTKEKLIPCRYAVSYSREQVVLIPEDPAARYFYYGTKPHPGKAAYIPTLRKRKKWITLKDPVTKQPIGMHPGIDWRKVGLRTNFEREIEKAIRRVVMKYFRQAYADFRRRYRKYKQLKAWVDAVFTDVRLYYPREEMGPEKRVAIKARRKWRPKKPKGYTPEDLLEMFEASVVIEPWDLWCGAWTEWMEEQIREGKMKRKRR